MALAAASAMKMNSGISAAWHGGGSNGGVIWRHQ